ncbi:hypothetical protein Q5P01_005807 [Channa striata]|uniref:Uncharacterized protein n=1 Tax=Channa striata TaxID=64152 RepID=A0AA88NEN1_CHASR|nr:hypothetical protein Q5P01_005807 [Channa striata]
METPALHNQEVLVHESDWMLSRRCRARSMNFLHTVSYIALIRTLSRRHTRTQTRTHRCLVAGAIGAWSERRVQWKKLHSSSRCHTLKIDCELGLLPAPSSFKKVTGVKVLSLPVGSETQRCTPSWTREATAPPPRRRPLPGPPKRGRSSRAAAQPGHP